MQSVVSVTRLHLRLCKVERLLFKPILPTSVFYEMRYPVTLRQIYLHKGNAAVTVKIFTAY